MRLERLIVLLTSRGSRVVMGDGGGKGKKKKKKRRREREEVEDVDEQYFDCDGDKDGVRCYGDEEEDETEDDEVDELGVGLAVAEIRFGGVF